MVYRGKPSTACDRCRGRRLKCDRVRPSCSQCIRAQVDCPGYRDTAELSFRDQSEEVIRKAQAKHRARRSPGTETINQQLDRKAISLDVVLSSPPEELAKGYFFTHFGGGHMPYLLDLTRNQDNAPINAALTAAGLAALSNLRMSPQLMLNARRHYTVALSRTNHALQDTVLARRDETLAAVVLLGMFEIITCSDGSFADRWVKHMDGAAQLIELRGLQQVERSAGLHLFTQLRAQIVLSRIYQERYCSPILAQLTEEAPKYRDPNYRTIDRLGILVIKLSTLCAAVKDGTIQQPTDIIRRSLSLDADFMSTLLAIPPTWAYSTVEVPHSEGGSRMHSVWGTRFHIYRNLTISSAWNNYRSARLVIHELIITAAKSLQHSSNMNTRNEQESLILQSERTCHQIVEDICASVPFHLGATAGDADACGGIAASPTGAGGITVVWPLLIAANSGFASPTLRNWVTDCLDKIGHSLGINQALAVAQLLRNGMRTRSFASVDSSEDLYQCYRDY
ncbi:hypothetical protein BO70DRAFT_432353 [Aspergillus heteromorphus CBS 117.55]|uniref:Zn(2)-C6 fungal-type domain-containing protein n=1 Tax=Aspergillus heteromorphus CBS 117.55 TaxID=1448321 RepID=A0A317V5Y0_9EURO|nr:uncharacterized protein BO70DRAFT_432353 [Aspergillus heteromorphus CBS 117.55]PWY69703.1 hypothetical protein BO70DRAFT_432353 [Aspergillus heteromorphus CBS 117.55]